MRGLLLAFCCALLVCVEGVSFSLPSYIDTQVVEIWSDWYFISQQGYDDTDGSVTIDITAEPNTLDISHTRLTFDAVTRENSFRIKPQDAGSYTLLFTMSNGDSDMRDFTSRNRTIAIEGLSRTTVLSLNRKSEPFQVRVAYPAENEDLTITPVTDTGSLVFDPSVITLPAGSRSASFRVTATEIEQTIVNWVVSGYDSDKYSRVTATVVVSVFPGAIDVEPLSSVALLGVNSSFYVATQYYPSKTVTVTPHAVDTVFNPASFDFTPGTRVTSFSVVSSSPSDADRHVYFDVSGAGAEDWSEVTKITEFAKKSISFQTPSVYTLNKKTYMSVRLSAPAAKSVSVSLYAGNLMFSPQNYTFSDTTTSVTIEITPKFMGADVISFRIDGADKDWYDPIQDVPITVGGGTFLSPSSWYVPNLWLGVESPSIPIRVSVAPSSSVTLIPTAADLTFNPPRLTFTASSQVQSFTITPLFTNTGVDDGVVSTNTISFIVDGPDYESYAAPDTVTVSVSRRFIQTSWSVHLTEDSVNEYNLYIGKQYTFWATASYAPPSSVTVTPTNPHITFNPAVIQFSPSVTHVPVTATVNAVGGSSSIYYIMGGKNAAYYSTPTPTVVNTKLRDLSIWQARVAPDRRVYYGVEIKAAQWPSFTTILAQNHVYDFSIRSSVIPDKSLTITPRSHHVTFSPASFELTFGSALLNLSTDATLNGVHVPFPVPDLYVSANFSNTPQSAGVHEVWFELSGDDAHYYDVPVNAWMAFKYEMRPATEVRSSASRSHNISYLILFLISVACAFMM